MAIAERELEQSSRPWRFNVDRYMLMGEMGWFLETRVELIEGVVIEKYPDTPIGEPRSFPWTTFEYHVMADLGWFAEKRVELIEGNIFEMPPMGARHITAVMLVSSALGRVFSDGYAVIVQNSFGVGVRSEPQPDVAILPGSIRDYKDKLPREAALIVEVSDTTLAYDRAWKMAVYAQADIPEYWIVNLVQSQVEVYRYPVLRTEGASGFGYAEAQIYQIGQSINPLAAPDAAVAVADLLP